MLLGYALGIESEIDPNVPIEVLSRNIAVGLADYWSIAHHELINALQDGIIDGHKLKQIKSGADTRARHELRQSVIDIFGSTPI